MNLIEWPGGSVSPEHFSEALPSAKGSYWRLEFSVRRGRGMQELAGALLSEKQREETLNGQHTNNSVSPNMKQSN